MSLSVYHIIFFILEAFFLLFFALTLYDYRTGENYKRIIATGMLLGLFFYALFTLPLISLVRLFLAGLACYGLAFWLFGLGKIRGLLFCLTLLGTGLAHEITVLLVLLDGFHQPPGNLLTALTIPAADLWAGLIPLALVTFLARLMNWRLPRNITRLGEPGYPLMNKHTVVLLAFSQLLLLAAAFIQYLLSCAQAHHSHGLLPTGSICRQLIILVSFAACIVLNIFTAGRIVRVYEKEAHLATRKAMAESFAGLAASIKAQNQDFTRHIQEISRLIQEGRLEDLSGYLENISGKITFLNSVLKVDNPIIGALLKAKATEADVKRIRLEIDISTSLAGLGAKALDLARITGNLIDNAFDAVLSLEEHERIVSVEIRRAGPLLQLEVSNRGQAIEAEMVGRIFEPCYTTKGEEHSGLGLHIVKTLAEKLMGTVGVITDETKGTRFVITLPGI